MIMNTSVCTKLTGLKLCCTHNGVTVCIHYSVMVMNKKMPVKQIKVGLYLAKFKHRQRHYRVFNAFPLNLTSIQNPHSIPTCPWLLWGFITVPIPIPYPYPYPWGSPHPRQPCQKRQQCRRSVRLCRKNRSTC